MFLDAHTQQCRNKISSQFSMKSEDKHKTAKKCIISSLLASNKQTLTLMSTTNNIIITEAKNSLKKMKIEFCLIFHFRHVFLRQLKFASSRHFQWCKRIFSNIQSHFRINFVEKSTKLCCVMKFDISRIV